MTDKEIIRDKIINDTICNNMITLTTVEQAKKVGIAIFNYALNRKKELRRLIIAILDHFDGKPVIQFLGNRIKNFFKESTTKELEKSFNFDNPYNQFGYFVKNNTNDTLYFIIDADNVDCLCDGGKSEKKNRIA